MAAPSNDNVPVESGRSKAEDFEQSQIVDQGVERSKQRRENKHALSQTKSAHKIVMEYLQPIMDAITAEMEACHKLPNKTARWVGEVEKVKLLDVAYLAFMTCLDGHDKEWGINTLRLNTGKAFVGLAFEAALSETREGFNITQQLEQSANQRTRFEHRQDYVMHIAKKRGFEVERWENNNNALMMEVGSALVLCVEKAIGQENSEPRIFKRRKEHKDEQAQFPQNYLVLTEEADKKLEQELSDSDYLSPYFSPVIHKPRPWNADQIGPYLSPSLNFVVGAIKHASPEQKEIVKQAMRDGSMDDALKALNTLQEVPYDVNMFVVDAIDWVRKRGLGRQIKKYPNTRDVDVPKFEEGQKLYDHVGGDWNKLSHKEQIGFMRDQTKARASNRQARANRSKVRRNLKEARQLAAQNTPFYMPHVWDRRGRVYHVCDFGHHNTDYLRAMFLLHNKTVVTEDAEEWLMLQLANTYGKDKLSYDERMDWVQENAQLLYDCAFDYKDKNSFAFWSKASEPFQFLAACHDWMKYQEAKAEGVPYYSGLPIALDCTQSGVQHYAAASKNLDDGLLVNLINNDENKPNDLYKACLAVAEVMIQEDLAENLMKAASDPVNDNDRLAEAEYLQLMQVKADHYSDIKNVKKQKDKAKRDWEKTDAYRRLKRESDILSAEQIQRYTEFDNEGNEIVGLNRGIVKRNVMTWAYSSKKFGFAKQLRSDWMDEMAKQVRLGELDEHPFGDDDGFAASHYLAKINEEAIKTVVKSAKLGMEFFQKLAAIMAQQNMHVTFRTPLLNFPVHQYYRMENKKSSAGRHKVYMFNHELKCTDRNGKMTFIEYTDTVDATKSESAIAPNVIHSMDATLLMLAVLECAKKGVPDLMVVHDSFATTAGNAAVMRQCIKDAFVKLYDDFCLYSHLLKQVQAQHPDPYNQKLSAQIQDVESQIEMVDPTDEDSKVRLRVLKKELSALEKRWVEWPDIPPKGELDISDIRLSDYFVT